MIKNDIIISASPMRVSLFGGGTDFKRYWSQYNGSVISLAINKYAYIILKKRYGEKIYLHWKIRETVSDIKNLKHDLIRESLKKYNLKKGVDIVCLSDISKIGSGLGSSSAFTASIIKAILRYKDININKKNLAEHTIDIENNKLKKPIGIQDQYISSYGAFRRFFFYKNGIVNVYKYKNKIANQLSKNLYLIPTEKNRKSESVLKKQNKNIINNIHYLKEISNITNKAHNYINKNNFNELGFLLNEYWEIKKNLADNVSNNKIDKLYEYCLSTGATGGKICGAGNGGFLLLYVPNKNKKDFENSNLQNNYFKILPDFKGTRIIRIL